jgi:hypothetical protein
MRRNFSAGFHGKEHGLQALPLKEFTPDPRVGDIDIRQSFDHFRVEYFIIQNASPL